MDPTLLEVAIFLMAAVFAAPLARRLGIGSVLGYLAAGVIIGPFGLGFIYSVYRVETILHFAEFGVVLLLFLIGLEMRPTRLKTMRSGIFGAGTAQVLATGALAALIGMAMGAAWQTALLIGLTLSLSSTAFALQVMQETGELNTQHGRTGFSILLFQDLAAIPLIALVPLFAVAGSMDGMSLWGALKALGFIAAVVVGGRLLLHRLFPLVAASGVREAMTASALLTVVGAALLMELGGLSAGLGAFIAGALLSESDYRHELEADIAPFEGLLLGLFFTAIGMSLDLTLLLERPALVLGLVVLLLLVKGLVLYGVGRWSGLGNRPSRRLALTISQGGEFAFVIFSAGLAQGVISKELSALLTVVVTLSMIATPVLLKLDSLLFKPKDGEPAYDSMPEDTGFVVIAGFGRFGQIAARILRARSVPFTALDISSEQVDFVRRFGNQIYYGDASRLDILEAARVGEARAFVLAIDDMAASLRTAALVRRNFPHVPVFARARNREHVHRLRQLGVTTVRRETFGSALDLSHELLIGLGMPQAEATRTVETFKAHDIKRLNEDFAIFDDPEKLRASAQHYAAELESLFAGDEAETRRQAETDA